MCGCERQCNSCECDPGGGGGTIAGCVGACSRGKGAKEVPAAVDWHYVDNGHGRYSMLTSYSYVGHGSGGSPPQDYIVTEGWRFRPSCLVAAGVLVVAGALSIAAVVLATPLSVAAPAAAPEVMAAPPARSTAQASTAPPSPEPAPIYNCDSAENLTVSKGQYCCEKWRKLCVTLSGQAPGEPSAPSDARGSFDCDAAYEVWEHAWSFMKKDWCCRHRDRGCAKEQLDEHGSQQSTLPDVPQPPMPFPVNCSVGSQNWRRGWSEAKKEYCCEREHKGCPERLS